MNKIFMRYLILDLNTGAMNGWYNERRMARECLAYMREHVPGRWVLLDLIDAGNNTNLLDMYWTEKLQWGELHGHGA